MHGNRYKTNSPKERFEEKFTKLSDDKCWIWNSTILERGHGRFLYKGKQQVASRVSYQLYVGEIPDGLLVCHKCDVRSCVNPSHLFLGTYKENSDDMFSKGRNKHLKGEENKSSKLTLEQVKEIKASDLSLRKIAEKFGITYGHAGKIRRNELWQG